MLDEHSQDNTLPREVADDSVAFPIMPVEPGKVNMPVESGKVKMTGQMASEDAQTSNINVPPAEQEKQ